MQAINQQQLANSIFGSYFKATENAEPVRNLHEFLFASEADPTKIETECQRCLENPSLSVVAPNSQKRFRFATPAREKLMNSIFQSVTQKDPDVILNLVQSNSLKTKTFFCIKIPKATASILKNELFRLAVAIGAAYVAFRVSHTVYLHIEILIGRVMPFVINNTPVIVFQVANKVIAFFERHYFKLLLFTIVNHFILLKMSFIVERMGRYPKIDAVWRLFTLNTLFKIISSTMEFRHYVWMKSIKVFKEFYNAPKQIGLYIDRFVFRKENELLAPLKTKVQRSWQEMIKEHAPKGVAA